MTDGPPHGVEVLHGRLTVVTALPLSPPARERLAQLLDARVVDVREPCERADVVLSPSSSPQLIDRLRRTFPGARVLVVELDDSEFEIELGGPVMRLARAGADGYLLADSLDELARRIASVPADPGPEVAERPTLPAGGTIEDVVETYLRAREERAAAEARRDRR